MINVQLFVMPETGEARMPPIKSDAQKTVKYFFLRSKEINIDDGLVFITLLARLTREIILEVDGRRIRKIEPVLVEIEEIKMEHSTEKIKALPQCSVSFNVSESVFRELLRIALVSPKEIHFVTPLHNINENKEIS